LLKTPGAARYEVTRAARGSDATRTRPTRVGRTTRGVAEAARGSDATRTRPTRVGRTTRGVAEAARVGDATRTRPTRVGRTTRGVAEAARREHGHGTGTAGDAPRACTGTERGRCRLPAATHRDQEGPRRDHGYFEMSLCCVAHRFEPPASNSYDSASDWPEDQSTPER
jgi:hypothetical protein